MRKAARVARLKGHRGEELELVSSNGNGAVVVAADVARRYGEGETAVDALRGVSVDIERGRLTAVMGPSGSGSRR